jgi:hypothetical protein
VFRKNGATVGSIGTASSTTYIAGDASGIRLGSTAFMPSTTLGANKDASVDLGHSAVRFKDLYLSGGVYLGGTGSANKLDDYEQGTWTPSLAFGGGSTGLTYVRREGKYTRIGNTVHVQGHLMISSVGTSTGTTQITGFPFPSYSTTSGQFAALPDRGRVNTNGEIMSIYLHQSNTFYLYSGGFDGGGNAQVYDGSFQTNSEIDINFTYQVQ